MSCRPTDDRPPLRIGLTGGIASGKSTVADLFSGLGAVIIDTDVIARDVVEPGEPALHEIRNEFGGEVIRSDGSLDRARLRRIVFADDTARARLEAILHPRIRAATLDQSTVRARNAAYQVIVVPLLVESPLSAVMDRIVVVDCDESTQIRRLMARDAESEAQARQMLAAQASRADRLALADDVSDNGGDMNATVEQVERLHRRYLALAAQQDGGDTACRKPATP